MKMTHQIVVFGGISSNELNIMVHLKCLGTIVIYKIIFNRKYFNCSNGET